MEDYKLFCEIRDQLHLMVAEGSADYKITKKEIKKAMSNRGYFSKNIKICKDNLMGFYRFNCDIVKK